jgi:hypothetical protein
MDSLAPAEKVVAVISSLFLGVPLVMWYLNLRRFGFRVFLGVPPMIRYVKGSVNALYFIVIQACIVIPGFLLVFNIATSDLYFGVPNFVWALLLCIACGCLLFLLQPPIILFLTTSDRENKEAIQSIKWSIGPWRIVYLLNLDNRLAGPVPDTIEKETSKGGVRQREDQDWQVVVHELMDLVPVIVLDARKATEAVVAEAKRILSSPKLSGKCLVVIGDNGEQPAVLQAANEMTERKVVRMQMSKLGQLAEALTLRIDESTH